MGPGPRAVYPSSSPSNVAISLVLPVLNEAALIDELHRRLRTVVESLHISYEIIFINDGSTDGSWQALEALAEADSHVKAINLSRNFGHQIAITAGLEASRGDAVVVMDSDLQDPPEIIPHLYAKFVEGFDVVYAQRRRRQGEGWLKRLTARMFYRLVRQLTNLDIPVDTGDFRLVSRRVVNDLSRFREHHRFIRGLVTWVGYQQTPVLYDRDPRHSGRSKFPFSKMVIFALDGITSMSIRPLRLASHIGLLMSVASFVGMVVIVIYKFGGGSGLVPGWTSLFVAALFVGGVQLLALGLLGEYIGRIHDEVKQRPMYLVRDRLNFEDSASHSAGT
ncbi:MAG: glycosyltransferase [Acidobacteria bacterium]|nr:glycosyltransferase [Acidobacteriota bacterium]